MDEIEKAKQNLLSALPFLRRAVEQAQLEGQPALGILAVTENGGRVVCKFDCLDFIKDIETVTGANPQSAEDNAKASVVQFMQTHNLQQDI